MNSTRRAIAECCHDDIQPGRFECVGQLDFLAHHRFGLDTACDVRLRDDIEDDPLRVLAVRSKVNLPAVLAHAIRELLQIKIEMIERVLLDIAGQRAECVRIRQFK